MLRKMVVTEGNSDKVIEDFSKEGIIEKQWEKNDAHIAGHKAKRNQPKPDYLVSTEVVRYIVETVKKTSN